MADSLASQIITAIGGPENVRSLTHCATRLRFELADASKVDQNALEHMKGVLGAVPQSGDRFQVVIGGGVATVYENIMHLPEMANAGAASASGEGQKSNADVKAEARSKARGKVAWLDSFFEYLADSFRPILGVLLGASIIIALVNLLISLNVIPNDEASAGWVFVKAIWKGVFYFLPIMVAYNAAKKLKVDPWLGGAIMAILMTPQFTSLIDAKTTTCVENAALGTKSCTANIFGIPMALSDYSGNVFVPLLMAAVLALVYHGLKKIIPESVQLVFVPFFCMIIVGALTAFIIGPIGVWVGNGLGVGLAWMNTHAPFIFAIIIPLLYPFLVPLGLHWPLNALMLMTIQTLGSDVIPENLQLIFVPFLAMLVMLPLTAFLIGPIGVYVGAWLGGVLEAINGFSPFIFALLIPMIYPFMVPLGLHWPLNAVMLININQLGYDFIQGPMGAWNFACFGATAGVLFHAYRDKEVQMRQTATGALAAGLLGGISEPSLYGIHLRFKKIYPRMLVGCFVGGLILGIGGSVTTNAFVFTSLLTIPAFSNIGLYALAIGGAFFTAFFMVVFFDYRTPELQAAARRATSELVEAPVVETRVIVVGDVETNQAKQWVAALGGEENVTKVEPIAETRVRVEVVDDSAVDVDALQRAGLTAAVQVAPGTWHLVAGLTAEQYAEGMRRRLVAT